MTDGNEIMMLHTFNYDGVSSASKGVYVLNSNTYDSPARDLDITEIQGANGGVLTDYGSYKNIEISYEIVLRPANGVTLEDQINGVKELLYKRDYGTYKRLSDDYSAGTYRYAIWAGPIDWELVLRKYGRTTIVFICKPQRYNGSGTLTEDIAAGSSATINLASAIGVRKSTDYLSIKNGELTLSGSTDVSGSITLQSVGAKDPTIITLNLSRDAETIDLISDKLQIIPASQIIVQTSGDTIVNMNKYITAMHGSWFQDLDFSGSVSQGITITNGTNVDIDADITWERWSL